ncbi:MAG TPA: TonB family protein [Gammaproteobacteria bacterium]|nr:TonB family protein [Gammaproteobacteria bacterium]
MKLAALLLSLQIVPIIPAATYSNGYSQYAYNLLESAASGNAKAQICLGEETAMGFNGNTGPNYQLALKFYEEAAKQSPLRADERIGRLYVTGYGAFKQDRAKAMSIFNGLIKKGYAPAATDVGNYYLSARTGFTPDFKKALYWFKRGAAGGDPYAEVALGRMYSNGLGVAPDTEQSKLWFAKAANHGIDCVPEYFELTNSIIRAHLNLQGLSIDDADSVGVFFEFKDDTAIKPDIVKKSNEPGLTEAWLAAIKNAKLPPWPEGLKTTNKHLGFVAASASWLFQHDLIYAIRRALVFPRNVIVYGPKGNGIVVVELDYLDGKVTNVNVKKSSGDSSEDAAAVQAVKNAHYSPTRPPYVDTRQHVEIPVDFNIEVPNAQVFTKSTSSQN